MDRPVDTPRGGLLELDSRKEFSDLKCSLLRISSFILELVSVLGKNRCLLRKKVFLLE